MPCQLACGRRLDRVLRHALKLAIMKRLFLLVFLCGSTFQLQAQETLLFTAELTHPEILRPGTGTFTLRGGEFSYHVTAPIDFLLGSIRGPPEPGMQGPLVFDLELFRCEVPSPAGPGFCEFRGVYQLSPEQQDQLKSEMWYVTATPPFTPSLVMRGQITLIPEPAAAHFFGLGLIILFTFSIWHRRARRRGAEICRSQGNETRSVITVSSRRLLL
jgi:hypothetical protein